LSSVKSLDGPRVRGISPVRKEKDYGVKDLRIMISAVVTLLKFGAV